MTIQISNSELRSHGCKCCIWRLHNQCPHDIQQDDRFIGNGFKDICKEYVDFILSFADEDDSVNVLWEKFSLYVARLQSLDDYGAFIKKRDEVNLLRKNTDGKDMLQHEIQLNTLRLWFERLNDSVRRGYGRIADREGKAREGLKLPGIMNAKTINFNLPDNTPASLPQNVKVVTDKELAFQEKK